MWQNMFRKLQLSWKFVNSEWWLLAYVARISSYLNKILFTKWLTKLIQSRFMTRRELFHLQFIRTYRFVKHSDINWRLAMLFLKLRTSYITSQEENQLNPEEKASSVRNPVWPISRESNTSSSSWADRGSSLCSLCHRKQTQHVEHTTAHEGVHHQFITLKRITGFNYSILWQNTVCMYSMYSSYSSPLSEK